METLNESLKVARDNFSRKIGGKNRAKWPRLFCEREIGKKSRPLEKQTVTLLLKAQAMHYVIADFNYIFARAKLHARFRNVHSLNIVVESTSSVNKELLCIW